MAIKSKQSPTPPKVGAPKTAAPIGREQECKKAATTVTGAGETSVHHADSDDDFDYGSESSDTAGRNPNQGLDRGDV